MRIRDELLKDFGTAGLPASSDPNINNTTGARQATGEETFPFTPRPVPEYKALPTNLPETVSVGETVRRSLASTNIGPAEDEQ